MIRFRALACLTTCSVFSALINSSAIAQETIPLVLEPSFSIQTQQPEQQQTQSETAPSNPTQGLIISLDTDMSLTTFHADVETYYDLTRLGWHLSHNTNLLNFVKRQDVAEELQFSPKQQKQLATLQQELQQAVRQATSQHKEQVKNVLTKKEKAELKTELKSKLKELREEFDEQFRDVLVPIQIERIRSLRFHVAVQSYGLSGTLRDHYAEELGISQKQKDEIKKITEDKEEAIKKKIEEMREQARQDIIDVLDKEQQKQLRELMPAADDRDK